MSELQNNEQWFADRCGYASASCFADVMAKGEGKTRAKYLLKIVAERLTGKSQESGYTNADMQRGTEQEPYARMAYEAKTGNLVQEVGFLKHASIMAGCSPDGLVDDDGGIEMKCVIPTVQIATIQRGALPPEHKAQVQGSLFVTERKWWDFVSYSPDLPANLRLFVFRAVRDEEYIKTLEAEITRFLNDVDTEVAKLSEYGRDA